MRILYDGQIFTVQSAGGINRYFANLIKRLPQDFSCVLTTCKSSNINYPDHPNLETFLCQKPIFCPGRVFYWLAQYYFRTVNALTQVDVFHPTNYSLLTRQELRNYQYPVVVTVYDMIHELFARQLDPQRKRAEKKRKAIQAAQAIICISENTKKDLLEIYSVPEEKVIVTYLASDIDVNLAHGSEAIPDRPYYLYVGGRNSQYKNFDKLLLAFAKASSVRPEITLCVVGAPFNEIERQMIAQLNLLDRIEHYQFPSDRHLAKLYHNSIGFVYPSLYEGFGIPPLEAMSCGTAVIASNSSSLPEVVGDAGILFNPQSSNDLADILLNLCDCPLERDRLIEKGYQQAKLFSWDKTVAQTLNVYQSVV